MTPGNKRKKLILMFCILGLVVISIAPLAIADGTVVKVFTVKNRFAEDFVAEVKMLLSPEGRVVTDENTNSLIINDFLRNIYAVEDFLKEYDKVPQQVRIKVNYVDDTDLAQAGLNVNWIYSNSQWAVGNVSGDGRGRNIEVLMNARKRNQNITGEQNLLIMSGANGMIETGRSIAYTNWFFQYSMTHGYLAQETMFRDVSTGFIVSPRVIGNNINIIISPRISYFGDKGTGEIIFREASTTVSCKDGEAVLIGSGNTTNENIVWNILGGASAQKAEGNFYIMLTAEIAK